VAPSRAGDTLRAAAEVLHAAHARPFASYGHLAAASTAAATARSAASHLRSLARFADGHPGSPTSTLRLFLFTAQRDGRPSRSIGNALSALCLASSCGLIPDVVDPTCRRMAAARINQPAERDWLPRAIVDRILEDARDNPSPHDRVRALALSISWDLGLVISQILRLRREHVELDHCPPRLWVTQRKRTPAQWVTLAPTTIAALRLLLAESPGELLVPDSGQTLNRWLRRATGEPTRWSWHCVRHGMATEMHLAGARHEDIAAQGRWASRQVLRAHYLHDVPPPPTPARGPQAHTRPAPATARTQPATDARPHGQAMLDAFCRVAPSWNRTSVLVLPAHRTRLARDAVMTLARTTLGHMPGTAAPELCRLLLPIGWRLDSSNSQAWMLIPPA